MGKKWTPGPIRDMVVKNSGLKFSKSLKVYCMFFGEKRMQPGKHNYWKSNLDSFEHFLNCSPNFRLEKSFHVQKIILTILYCIFQNDFEIISSIFSKARNQLTHLDVEKISIKTRFHQFCDLPVDLQLSNRHLFQYFSTKLLMSLFITINN